MRAIPCNGCRETVSGGFLPPLVRQRDRSPLRQRAAWRSCAGSSRDGACRRAPKSGEPSGPSFPLGRTAAPFRRRRAGNGKRAGRFRLADQGDNQGHREIVAKPEDHELADSQAPARAGQANKGEKRSADIPFRPRASRGPWKRAATPLSPSTCPVMRQFGGLPAQTGRIGRLRNPLRNL